jgi:glycosidase
VPGHTSIDHPWFKESARQRPASPYRNWFIWTDSAWDNGGDPWNKKMVHGYANRNGNFLINFFWSQPALNFGFAEPEADKLWQLPTTHEDVQALWREMRRILRFWLEMGADGFRVDMADSIIRNDPHKKEIRRFWRETREELSRDFPDIFLIAEGHPSNLLDGTGFHSAYLHWAKGYWEVFRKGETFSQELGKMKTEAYFDRSGRGDFRPYLETWRQEYSKTKDGGVITVPVGNHDLPRIANGQSEDDLELIFAFQTSWPGIPFIYYGDELGLRQQSSDNPVHEGHYPTRNGARTPMHWDDSTNCGFSTCLPTQLYLPVDPFPGDTTVATQEARSDSLLKRVRKLNALHRETPAFAADTPIEILGDGAPGEPLVFLRGSGKDSVLCFFQPADKYTRWLLPDFLPPLVAAPFAGSASPPFASGRDIICQMPGWSFWSFNRPCSIQADLS